MALRIVLACLVLSTLTTGFPFESREQLREEQMLIEEFDRITDLQEKISGLTPSNTYLQNKLPLQQYFNIRTWETLRSHAILSQSKGYIKQQIKTYQPINPKDTMAELTRIGPLMTLAYSGAKGRKCSTPILDLMGKYQDLVKDSLIVTSTYVEAAMKAIRYHKYAIMFLERGKSASSIKYLTKCSILAGRMATMSEQVEKESDKLTGEALAALKLANSEQTVESQAKRDLEKEIKKLEQKREDEKRTQANIKEAIKREEKEIKENLVTASQQEMHPEGYYIRIFWFIRIHVNDKRAINHNARVRREKAAAKQAIEVAKKNRKENLKQQRSSNTALKRAIAHLANMNNKGDRLSQTIASLDITVKSMGKIKTAFANTRVFWNGLKQHLEALKADGVQQKEFLAMLKEEEMMGDEDMMIEFTKMVEYSGYSWVAVATQCLDASETIKEVNKGLDKSMNNLPNEAEALVLIKTISKELLKHLETKDKELAEEEQKSINQ